MIAKRFTYLSGNTSNNLELSSDILSFVRDTPFYGIDSLGTRMDSSETKCARAVADGE